jgi:enolase-phosphatase E1
MFTHTEYGNLAKCFKGFFDTTQGGKKEVQSYVSMAAKLDLKIGEGMYLSDHIDELDAAAHAGWQTVQIVRDAGILRGRHKTVTDFYALAF